MCFVAIGSFALVLRVLWCLLVVVGCHGFCGCCVDVMFVFVVFVCAKCVFCGVFLGHCGLLLVLWLLLLLLVFVGVCGFVLYS